MAEDIFERALRELDTENDWLWIGRVVTFHEFAELDGTREALADEKGLDTVEALKSRILERGREYWRRLSATSA